MKCTLTSKCRTKTDGTEKKESKRFLQIADHAYDFKNYPRDTENDTSDIVDLGEFVVSDVEQPAWDGVELPNLPYELSEETGGFWYTTIVHGLSEAGGSDAPDATINLVSCNDGNIYMQEDITTQALDEYRTCASLWGGFDDAILSDPNGGFLYYYGNTMSAVGVSRVRTAYAQEVPDTAVMVLLAPFYYDDANEDASLLAAFDSEDNMFLPVVCTYNESPSAKIYLVKDLEEGISMLKSPDLKYSVTNGDVAECELLPLTWGADVSKDVEPSWMSVDEEVDFEEADFGVEIEFDDEDFADGEWIVDDEADADASAEAGAGTDDADPENLLEVFEEPMFDEDEYFK
jgi:hypothetical protein